MTEDTGDHGMSEPGAWAFDASVTRVFDEMLARSIPQYEVMRSIVENLAARAVALHQNPKHPAVIVDLGASRGEMTARLFARCGAQARYVMVETAPAMLDALAERWPLATQGDPAFAGSGHGELWVPRSAGRERGWDLRAGYPPVTATATLSVLTLQFTPIEYRQRIVRDVYRHTREGGVFILVEKLLGATAELDEVMVDEYLKLKAANGYTQEEIARKKLALEGVLVPVTARWNEELLRGAGFTQVDCVWRWHNFAAWLAIKE